MDSVPIILLDGITDEEKATRIKDKFKEAVSLGALVEISNEVLEHTPRLRWPDEPEIAKDESEQTTETKDDEVLTLVKYNFVVDRRNVFRCPHCDKLFTIKELTMEESQEAGAQAEIAERLQKRETPQAKPVQAVPVPGVEEMEPIQEVREPAGMMSSSDAEIMDLATFEEGLSAINYDSAEAPELALPPDMHAAPAEGQAQDFYQELESLPVEAPDSEAQAAEPVPAEAVQKESELHELAPEEAMKFFEGRQTKDEEEEPKEEGKKKIMAPRRGAARRRMQRLREKQEERGKGERRRPSSRRRGKVEPEPEEEMEEAPEQEIEHTEGFHGVVLSRIGSKDKKKKSAKLIVELTGMHPEDARDMCEGTFINVIKGVSEEEANEIAARFKEFGVSAKVTLQKRKKRQSERMQRRK
jgi:ribosomal protein L7/L12